ncbi:MAG: Kelch repeat-containing protein [Promethearchaeota archaeon]
MRVIYFFSLLLLVLLVPCYFGFSEEISSQSSLNTSKFSIKPTQRTSHKMVYDPVNQKVILFGGIENSDLFIFADDMWIYDYSTNTWAELDPTTNPSPRINPSWVYNSDNQSMFLFGGMDSLGRKADTWLFNYSDTQWIQIFPEASPPARDSHSMIYDPVNQKVILFGGYGASLYKMLNDTWAYDYTTNTWTELTPAISPSARYGHTMIYDNASQKGILFGGHSWDDDNQLWIFHNDTWTYDYATNTWTELIPHFYPSARYWHSMTYDSVSKKVILFGGIGDPDNKLNDTWIYDYLSNEWVQDPSEVYPSGRFGHDMVFDSANQKIILFGGRDSSGTILNDTWAYSYHESGGTWELMNSSNSSSTTTLITDFLTLEVVILALGTFWSFIWYRRKKHRQ